MAVLRLFAAAREAAGLTTAEIAAPTVGDVLDEACRRFGDRFAAVLGTSRLWVNGQPADRATVVDATDVLAVLPPVSGGASPATNGAAPPWPQSQFPPPTQGGAPTQASPALQSRPQTGAPTPPQARTRGGAPTQDLLQGGPPTQALLQGGPPIQALLEGEAPTQARTGLPTQLHPAPPGAEPHPAAPALPAEPRPVLHPSLIVRGNLALVPDLDPEAEPTAEPEGATGAAAERPPLAVVHKSVRPHGRLGLVWAVVTVGAAVAGPTWLAAWLAVAAFVAGAQASVAWRKRGERPLTLVAAVVAAALPVAASFNTGAMTGVVVAGLLVAFVARLRAPSLAPSRDVALTLTIGVPIGLAAAAPVLVRQTGIAATLLLLAFACFYDAGAYLVGTGAASAWEGPAAGVVALIPVTIFASVVLIPPFSGAEPLLLGFIAAVLAPAGPVAASALLGDRSAHAPALRRLDSLLLMGPLWALCAAVMLR